METESPEALVSSNNCTVYMSAVSLGLIVYFLYAHLFSKESWEQYGVKHISLRKIIFDDFGKAMAKLIQEEGDTVGFTFAGLQLLTRDLDLLKEVLVKDFNNFVDRSVFMASNSPMEKSLFFQGGHDWRRLRHLITPSFSTGKLKQLTSHMNTSASKLTDLMVSYAMDDRLVPIKHVMCQFTGDVIARTAFNLTTNCLDQEDDEFVTYSKQIFKIHGRAMNFIMLLMLLFPRLHQFLVKKLKVQLFDSVDEKADKYFLSILNSTIEERKQLSKQGKKVHTDLLQNLIAAQEAGEMETKSITYEETVEEHDSHKLSKTMSQEELYGQSILLIFAGFETTASTLQMCFYYLAKHPNINVKVCEEIQRVVTSETPTYEEISKLKYMEQVINETLRLFPPAPIITRKAAETRQYGDITIPKGAGVTIPVDMILRNPKHYPDPEKFDPERFTEENMAKRDPMTFVPFGYGPRQCIGMRLAYMELKYCLVHVLRKVKFELNQRTEPKPDGDIKTSFQGFVVVEKPIMLAVTLRNY